MIQERYEIPGYMRATVDGRDLPVPVRDRLVPPTIRVEVRSEGKQPALSLKIEVRDGVPLCTEVNLLAHPHGPEIRPSDLRAVHLDTLVEQAVSLCSYQQSQPGVATKYAPTHADRLNAERARRGSVRRGRPKVPTDRLREVADLYRRHVDGGRPLQVIAEVLDVDPRTAARYVEKCRSSEYKLLPPRERA